jgi:acyl-coenzyme A thioesterase PaaI-like protein
MAKSLAAPTATLARWWQRLSSLPGGKTLFSILVGRLAPYTGSIGAQVMELRPGYARWALRDRRRVRNHLNSIHAIAIANLAEVASGTAMLMTIPPGVRGIVTALSIEYLKKARGRLVAECRCEVPPVSEEREQLVESVVRDEAGDIVARATVRWRLAPAGA